MAIGEGLYVHVPFCETKCGYCDFFSVAIKDRDPGVLVGALLRELGLRLEGSENTIRTIFVGGGTPTVLPVTELGRLFEALGGVVRSNDIEEFTVEANPASVDDEKIAILTSAGVDRLSLGAQSWQVDELATLERLHTPEDIAPAIDLARRHGIERLNLDLIFGIPGQTLQSWMDSLERTLDLGVDHVCCYGLTYEPGTRMTASLQHGRVNPCDEDLEADMYLAAIDRLAAAGYEQYEISNFAPRNQRCLHNMIYWRNDDYIGVGPSAAGYVDGVRYKNIANIVGYVRGIGASGYAVAESERITGRTLAGETLMMQLRLNDGIDVARFVDRTGVDPHRSLRESLEKHVGAGLVESTDSRIALTRRGRMVADTIIGDFYTELHLGS